MPVARKILPLLSVTGLALAFPALSVAAKNLDEYPLRIHIVQTRWHHYGSSKFHYSYEGEGRGNVEDGQSIQAFDYSYGCSAAVERTIVGAAYPGKWKKPQTQLSLLIPELGQAGKYHECELKTNVLPGIYVNGPGGFRQVSQDEFQARRHAPRTTPTPQAAQASASPDAAAGSRQGPSVRLSVSSSPDGADIAVDGDFMGNAPSSVELPLGEHTIGLRKPGYKAWERKLKLTGGDIRLNAELEKDAQK